MWKIHVREVVFEETYFRQRSNNGHGYIRVACWGTVLTSSVTDSCCAVRIHSPEANTVRSEQASPSPVEFLQAVLQRPLVPERLWNWQCSVNTFTAIHYLISSRPSRLQRRTRWRSGENTGLYSGGLLFEQAVCGFPKTPHLNARIVGIFN
jgi:hypothetical protein